MNKNNTVQSIQSESDKKNLLSDMVRFQSDSGLSAIKWMETLTELFITMPTAWYMVNVPLQDEYADLWIESNGQWDHGSGLTKSHNRLGMAYAWWVLHKVNGLEEIHLLDSPDFWGIMRLSEDVHSTPTLTRVCGDIGKCSPIAMLHGVRKLRFHDTWISVIDWNTQALVQFGYNVTEYQGLKLWSRLGKIQDYSQAIKNIFFCQHCDEWSISEESRQELIEWWQSH